MRAQLCKRVVIVASVSVVLNMSPVLAHHSRSAQYDDTKPVTIKGTLTKMDWTNPHAWIYLDVKDPDGKVVEWKLEFGSRAVLIRSGWRPSDLPVGAEVTITGHLARDGSPTAIGDDVRLPDGRRLFGGSPAGDR